MPTSALCRAGLLLATISILLSGPPLPASPATPSSSAKDGTAAPNPQTTPETEIDRAIRRLLEHGGAVPALGGRKVVARESLARFYERRLYRRAWQGPQLDEIVAALDAADADGLDPGDYPADALRALRRDVPSQRRPALEAELDVLATDAFLVLAGHLVSGRVDPVSFDRDWLVGRREVDLVTATERAAAGTPSEVLDSLRPRDPGYERLRRALAKYRAMEPWPAMSDGETLRPGDRHPRVAELRHRLGLEATDDPELYDAELERAVRQFQERHGLAVDAAVGAKTLAALRVSPAERARQIALNLERWRWLPRELGERHVLVNIPDFDLRVYVGDTERLRMRVVVGRTYRSTPVMSDTIRYLVLNPTWGIPPKLAVQDKLPEIRENPDYFREQGIEVLRGWGSEETAIDPATVDWSKVSAKSFPYHLRQRPGPKNALGKVKFMFPNRWNIYIHDTPSREAFGRAERAQSSGCIRAEHPIDLAEVLLENAPGWDRAAIEATIEKGQTRNVPLPKPVPVHIEYWTAWVDDDGEVQFRNDIYERDGALETALAGPTAAAERNET